MNITSLLSPERVVVCDDIASKKRLLEHLGELLGSSSPRLSKQVIFDALINREKLGSTGLGKGVAIPHGRMAELEEPVCAFIRVKNPVDFDASDGKPVDLVFSLLVPEESTEEHLQVLSTIAEIFSNTGICNALRQCDDGASVLDQLYQWESRRISA
ncbi:MAG: PTS IIA-like nitrogen regulatory protein PtsN [Gammaproteobacteria bacterium]|nr:PTS IIA-like nitrogen regulatory protein PtsN [Gammaproteobacteria bacterium]